MAQPGFKMAVEDSAAEILGLGPTVKVQVKPDRDVFRREDSASGDVALQILELPPGARVAAAPAAVGGATFRGRIANLQGARVTASPVIRAGKKNVAPTSTEQAFIVDFGRSISVLGLDLVKDGVISLVVPWMGTDFAPDPAYERPAKLVGSLGVALSGLETTKLLVQVRNSSATAASFAGECTITTGTLPSNVRASLNGRLPFFSRPGPLDRAVTLTGLAEDLDALVADAEEPVAVTLALTTDTPGVLKLDFDAAGIAVQRSAPARWGAQESTAVTLAALEPQALAVPLVAGSATTTWQIASLTAEVTGEFGPWRAHPAQSTSAPGPLGVRVDATFSVARRVLAAHDVELHGVALPLRGGAAPAELHVELLKGGAAPPQAGAPLAAAELALPAGGAGAAWHEVLFDGPVAVAAATGAWLVVQARTGSVEWASAAEPAGAATATLGAAQGGRWERYPPVGGAVVVAQARLLRAPLPTENAPLLTIAWADLQGAPAAIDPGRERTMLELTRSGAALETGPATGYVLSLSVTAAASGTLRVERATTHYREKTP